MSLDRAVVDFLERMRDLGWQPVFARHGWDLEDHDFERPLDGIDRTAPGFQDFCPNATRPIEPGHPARSLLYHAFASPLVHPTSDGTPCDPARYPTPDELDLLENYVYGRAPIDVEALDDAVVAVFAYEYRVAARTPHEAYADLVFSRTGVSRVGATESEYDPVGRCYRNAPEANSFAFAVTPARYAAFLARPVDGRSARLSIMGGVRRFDRRRRFYLPLRKLFDGPECIPGFDLSLDFEEYHEAVKLNRLVEFGHKVAGMRFDRTKFDHLDPPFKRTSVDSPDLAILTRNGASALLSSKPAPLVRLARQRTHSGELEIVHFTVPSVRPGGVLGRLLRWLCLGSFNRKYTSLLVLQSLWKAILDQIAGGLLRRWQFWPRNVPEFVNIRHKLDDNNQVVDLSGSSMSYDEFENLVARGGYEAALFEDGICEGCVTVRVAGLDLPIETEPAFSIVTAPDFFAYAHQLDLNAFFRRSAAYSVEDHYKSGGPEPLCFGRLRANPDIRLPHDARATAFSRRDKTIAAIVALRPEHDPTTAAAPNASFRTSFMTDAASGVFAPGWDVTYSGSIFGGYYYSTRGLGCPFPEDVKLCAAANSYWPAASPDASRTFMRTHTPTALPLMDAELGFHANHPAVLAGLRPSSHGWDGEYGPFFEKVESGWAANFADIDRSDYVSNTLRGRVTQQLLAHDGNEELILRMDAIRRAIYALTNGSQEVNNTRLWLISAEHTKDWSVGASAEGIPHGLIPGRPPGWAGRPGDTRLQGPGYLMAFVEPKSSEAVENTLENGRLRVGYTSSVHLCQVSTTHGLCASVGGSEFIYSRA